jgi:hypothetical protein
MINRIVRLPVSPTRVLATVSSAVPKMSEYFTPRLSITMPTTVPKAEERVPWTP